MAKPQLLRRYSLWCHTRALGPMESITIVDTRLKAEYDEEKALWNPLRLGLD
jgi:hypothetical protein